MIVYNVEQGTPEWHQSRAGKITASMFQEVRKRLKSGPRKGQCSDAADKYAFRLATERVTGKVAANDQFTPFAARRGNELEGEARLLHEEKRNTLIQLCGFVATDDEIYGASADGFIGLDGCAEYKCFSDPTKLKDIWLDLGVGDAMDQIQGQLWITERDYCDFCVYYPEMEENPLSIRKVYRDDAFIAEMIVDLKEFNNVVQSYHQQILERPTGPIEIPAAMENAA